MLANEAAERYAPAMKICCYLDSPVATTVSLPPALEGVVLR